MPDRRSGIGYPILFGLVLLAFSFESASAQTSASSFLYEKLILVWSKVTNPELDPDPTIDSLFDHSSMSENQLDAIQKISSSAISEGQRSKFRDLLKLLVRQSFKRSVPREYQVGKTYFLIVSQDVQGDITTVHTKSVEGRSDLDEVTIDYKLRNTSSGWKIVDYLTNGVSLAAAYRSQFTKIVRDQGFESLLEKMRAKFEGRPAVGAPGGPPL